MSAPGALFFYGTLRDPELLQIVLGHAPSGLRPARLADHAVRWAEGQSFPMIVGEPGGVAEGVLLDLSAEAVARLDFYEGGFAYDLRDVTVAAAGPQRARCYFPAPGRWLPGAPWLLSDWQARWGPTTRTAAREAMGEYGRMDAATLVRRLPTMRARAWASELARDPAPCTLRSGLGSDTVSLGPVHRRHTGFFGFDEVTVDHPAFSGGRSGPLSREAFRGGEAAILLPYDPARDRVLLVEQFRVGPLMRGDPRPWTLEPVAGLVDAGEAPEETARREAREEAGLDLDRVEHVLSAYPSPGASTEFFHCFVGLCDLPDGHESPGGVDTEGEDIRTHLVSLDAAMALIGTGEANVLPLATLLFWTQAHKARLARQLEVDGGVT